MFCDETRSAPLLSDAVAARRNKRAGAWGVLIGPVGGFAPSEVDDLRGRPFVIPANLGPRILRVETAAIAALTLWQAAGWRLARLSRLKILEQERLAADRQFLEHWLIEPADTK